MNTIEKLEAILKRIADPQPTFAGPQCCLGTFEDTCELLAGEAAEALSLLSKVRGELGEMKRAWERTTEDARMYKGVCVKADLWPITVSPNYWAKPRPSRPVPDHGSGPEYLPAPPKEPSDV